MSQGAAVVLETNAVTQRAHMQDVVNRLYEHYIVKKSPPAYENGGCVYQDEGGACCAVGLFIPENLIDEVGRQKLNSIGSISFIAHRMPFIIDALPVRDLYFWKRLQKAHDTPADIGLRGEDFTLSFASNLEDVCRHYNLAWSGDVEDEARAIDVMIAEGGRH